MLDISPRDLLLARTQKPSARGARDDSAHLAIVLEGGGMRGVVSVAMSSTFEERGHLALFDSVHGSSAGACGGTYFASGQATYGAAVYYEDINNKKFINLFRPLWGQPIMRKEFLVDHVFRRVKPLAVDRILDNPGFLHIVLTDARTGKGVVLNQFRDAKHLFDALRATICLPIIAGRHSLVDGAPYIDGGLSQQIAIQSAIDAGATHIVVLFTRASDELEREIRDGFQIDATGLGLVYGPEVERVYRGRNTKVNELLAQIETGVIHSKGRKIRVDSITRPDDSVRIGRLTIDGVALKQAYLDGRAASAAYLDDGKVATSA